MTALLDALSQDLIRHALKQATPLALLRAASTCQQLRAVELQHREELWEALYRSAQFTPSVIGLRAFTGISWKTMYKSGWLAHVGARRIKRLKLLAGNDIAAQVNTAFSFSAQIDFASPAAASGEDNFCSALEFVAPGDGQRFGFRSMEGTNIVPLHVASAFRMTVYAQNKTNNAITPFLHLELGDWDKTQDCISIYCRAIATLSCDLNMGLKGARVTCFVPIGATIVVESFCKDGHFGGPPIAGLDGVSPFPAWSILNLLQSNHMPWVLTT